MRLAHTLLACQWQILHKNVSGEWLGMPLMVEESETEVGSEALVNISSVSLTPLPSTEDVQFVSVEAIINNPVEPISGAQLSLLAYIDGVEVERFPISQSLSVPSGDTSISTRYIPLSGWTSGTWTFELLLEDVQGNTAIVIGRQLVEGSIVIP